MGCEIKRDAHGQMTAIVCKRGPAPTLCLFCAKAGQRTPSTKLCDFPIRGPVTCDAPMCAAHAKNVGPNRDLCPNHVGATP